MSIKKKFASSAGWMLIGTSSDYVVQFVIFAVLARLLSVSDIGVVAFAIVLIDIGRFFVNSGFNEALVQRPEWDDHVSSVCFTVSVLLALLFSTLLAVGGGFLLEWYYQAGSGLPMAALASIFILEALRIVQSAKLRREFRYKSLAARGTAASLLSGIGAIVLALNGWGIWALVIQRLVYQSVMTAATWQSARWTPSLKLDRAVLRELAPFTLRIVASRSMEVLGTRSPDLLVGLLFGPVGVGFYRIGARGMEAIVRIGIQPFQDAAFAAFSRVAAAALIGQAYLKLTRAAAVLTFPIYLGAATVATEIVVLIFGPKYAESGPIFTALAFGGVSSTIVYFTLAAYLAAGNTGAMLRSSVVALACNLSLVPAIAWIYGPLGAAIGVSLGQTVVAALNLHLLRRHLAVSPKALLEGVIPPLLAATTMALVLNVVKYRLLADWDIGLRLVALVSLGMVIYSAFILLIGRRYSKSLLADMAPLLPSFVTRRARWLFPKV